MGVYTGGRRATLPLDDEGVAWVRVTSACDLGCRFCLDADRLDGSVRPFDEVVSEIDAAADAGHTRVVLSGGEPTKSPHLLKVIRHAKSRDLIVSLTTNGQMLAAAKPCQMVADAGLDEVRVSLHSGVRSVHDVLVQQHGAWVRSLSALRHAVGAGLVVTLHMVLTEDNAGDLSHLVHLAAMSGVKRARLYALRPEGLGATSGASLALDGSRALSALDLIWRTANDEGVELRATGFGSLPDTAPAPNWDGKPQPVEAGALSMLRQGIRLPSLQAGGQGRDADGKWGRFLELAQAEGGLRALGAEIVSYGVALHDLPRCVGGTGQAPPEAAGTYVAACEACPEHPRCPGVAGLLARKVGDAFGWPES